MDPTRPKLGVALHLGSHWWVALTTDLPEWPGLRDRPGAPGVPTCPMANDGWDGWGPDQTRPPGATFQKACTGAYGGPGEHLTRHARTEVAHDCSAGCHLLPFLRPELTPGPEMH